MDLTNLVAEFKSIKKEHKTAIQKRVARLVPGGSVIRVFRKKTKEALIEELCKIPVAEMRGLKNQEDFRKWFERQLEAVASAIRRTNRNNRSIKPGTKWGHAAKVLNLFLREMVVESRYFLEKEVKRLTPWLYMPIDRVVIKNLRDCGIELDFKVIKDIDTRKKFYYLQEDILASAAAEARVPRIWFDDVWSAQEG